MNSITAQHDKSLVRHILCVFGGGGFPHGLAPTVRLRLVARTLLEYGFRVTVLHCGSSPWEENRVHRGNYRGVDFEYTTGVTRRPDNRWARWLLYAWGLIRLTARLVSFRFRNSGRVCVYLSSTADVIALLTGIVCWTFGIPVIKDVCEWWPGVPGYPKCKKWLFFHPFLETSVGAVAISLAIADRLKEATKMKPMPVFLLPVLVDAQEIDEDHGDGPLVEDDYALWCGDATAYIKDVEFLIRVAAKSSKDGKKFRLVVAGKCSEKMSNHFRRYSEKEGFFGLEVTGYVSETQLAYMEYYARVLLLPLWDDERSKTRFPTKLGEYLMTGRPVITCTVGEPARFLQDNVNAFLCNPGDEEAFAAKLNYVLNDWEQAAAVGMAGKDIAMRTLDYRGHVKPLGDFVLDCMRPSVVER
jgi:glycosyltransferase involved in cell wall biosynthesis